MTFKEFMYRRRMAPRGLRHKLWATFALGTVIPFLLLVYILQEHAFKFYPRVTVSSSFKPINFFMRVLPMERFPSQISIVIVSAVALSLVGLYFTKSIIDRILTLTSEARTVVQESNFTQQIRVMSEDEIGELRDTLNFVIARLQQNMQELEQYEKRLITSEKEKHALMEKTRDLTIRDEITGFYNARYFQDRWKEEIRRAMLFQRPCALLSLQIGRIKGFQENEGADKVKYILKEISKVIMEGLKGIEKISHPQIGEFMVILPERNKKEALVLGEIILKKVKDFIDREKLNFILNGGVVSSPLDGVESAELIAKVREAAKRAYKEGPGKILEF